MGVSGSVCGTVGVGHGFGAGTRLCRLEAAWGAVALLLHRVRHRRLRAHDHGPHARRLWFEKLWFHRKLSPAGRYKQLTPSLLCNCRLRFSVWGVKPSNDVLQLDSGHATTQPHIRH